MPGVQRQGDPNMFGGIATGGESSVLVNGRPIMTPFQVVTPHPPCPKNKKHCVAFTKGGSRTVFANHRPVIRSFVDKDTCGDMRLMGSNDVNAM